MKYSTSIRALVMFKSKVLIVMNGEVVEKAYGYQPERSQYASRTAAKHLSVLTMAIGVSLSCNYRSLRLWIT